MTRFDQGRLVSALGLVGALLASCQPAEAVQWGPSLTREQASQQAEQLARQTFAGLAVTGTLEPDTERVVPCDGPDQEGKILVEKNYRVVLPGSWSVDRGLSGLVKHWERQGYRLVTDHRGDRHPTMVAENPTDRFRTGVTVVPVGTRQVDVRLSGSSPCVWEHGTPAPRD